MRPATATMTMQPSVACGRSLSTPPRNSAQATARSAVATSLPCVTAPARWLMAVCENPPADGMARKKEPARQATPLAASSWSLSMGGSSRSAHGAGDGRRLEEAHDGDGERPADQVAETFERRCHRRREPGRHRRDQRHAVLVDRPHGDQHDAEHDGHQRARHARHEPRESEQDGDGDDRQGDGRPADVAEVLDQAAHLADERAGIGIAGDAEQLGQLAGGDGEPDTDLDPRLRRLRDVVDEGTELEQPGDQQDHADEERERREVARRDRYRTRRRPPRAASSPSARRRWRSC